MTNDFSIESKGGVATIRFHRGPDINAVKAAIEDLSKAEPQPARLWDLSCGGLDLSHDDLRRLVGHMREKLLPARAAVVAPTDIDFAQARIYGAYSGREGSDFAVFRNEREARAWLDRGAESQQGPFVSVDQARRSPLLGKPRA